MKKILSSLFLFILCVLANAQNNYIQKVAEFDFSDPSSLNPSITPAEAGSAVDINGYTFINEHISLTLDRTAFSPGASIDTFYDKLYETDTYSLSVYYSTYMGFKCDNAGILNLIEFTDRPDLGGIGVSPDMPGEIKYWDNDENEYVRWESDENNPTDTLSLENKSVQTAHIYTIKVYYSLPTNILVPTIAIPSEKTINSISELILTFDKELKTAAKSAGITANFKNESKSIKSVTIEGKTATITLAETFDTDGTLVINIPAGTFEDVDGFCNRDLTYTYNIVRKRDALIPEISPDREINALRSGDIKLSFSDVLLKDEDFDKLDFALLKTGTPIGHAKPILEEGSSQVVLLEFSNLLDKYQEPIKESGVYTINIPEKSFYNSWKGNESYETWNPEIKLEFEICEGAVLVPEVSLDPAKTVESFSEVKLIFKKDVAYTETEELTVKYNGEAQARTVTVEGAVASITLAAPIATDGTVAIHVPESCFVTADEYSNKELDYTFTIKTAASEKKEVAKAFYDKYTDKVGYPTSTSAAAKALLAEIKNPNASVESFKNAMDKYYAETDVRIPTDNEYYKIVSINSKNPADSLYVAYEDGKIVLTADKSKSAVFLSSKNEDKVVLKTTDGKYLHVFTSNNEFAPTTSATCVTNAKSEVNDLTIAKLVVEGKAEETFGKLSMKGLLGKNDLNEESSTYAVTNFENGTFIRSTAPNVYFEELRSSALIFQATEKPDFYTNIYTKSVSAKLDNNKYILTVTFYEADDVSPVESPIKATVKSQSGSYSQAIELSGTNDVFTADLGTIEGGKYELVIPAKALVSYKNGEDRYNNEITAPFEVIDVVDPSVGFKQEMFKVTYLWYYFDQEDSHPCEALNDYILYIDPYFKHIEADFSGLYNRADSIKEKVYNEATGKYEEVVTRLEKYYVAEDIVPSRKVVKVYDYYKNELVRHGRFERYTEIESDSVKAIRLVFDEGPIQPNELNSEIYVFYFEAATYGDANFGKYLDDPNSIPAEKCNVNPSTERPFHIDNKWIDLTYKAAVTVRTDSIGENMSECVLVVEFSKTDSLEFINPNSEVKIKTNTGKRIKDETLVKTAKLEPTDDPLVMTINLSDMVAGNYNLVLPSNILTSTSKYGGVRYNKESAIRFTVKESTTSINSAIMDNNSVNAVYDIFGRKVSDTSQPGIYIINGKKVMKR